MNITNTSKFISISTILIVFAFLINNYLTFAGDWPGAFTLSKSINVYSLIQSSLYIFAVFAPIVFVYRNRNLSNLTLADDLEKINDFIIRFGFW